jgi:hypothetical protein
VTHAEEHREYLWQLLDDISTAGDMAKSDDERFRRLVEKIVEKRSKVANSYDGHTLVWEKSVKDEIIAGAMFDFMGNLTGGEDLVVGETHHPEDILNRFKAWAETRGLAIDDADVENWNRNEGLRQMAKAVRRES